MALVPAKCTECGANLEVDASKDAANCPYCGAAFITEKAINNYNISNIEHADIKAENVIVNVHTQSPRCLKYKRIKGGWCIYKMNLDVETPNELHIPTLHKGEPILYIEPGTFPSASWFDDITVDADNKYISVQNGCVINNETHTLVTAFGEDIVIPDTVIEIGESALSCAKIKEIKIPSSVKKVGKNAFDIGPNLKVYVDDLKSWCDIDFEDDYSNPLNFFENRASELYVKGQLVEDLVIPEGVTRIGTRAFYRYLKLKSVVIADSVTDIGEHAFSECINLKKFTFGKGLKTMASNAVSSDYNYKVEIEEVYIPNLDCWLNGENICIPHSSSSDHFPTVYIDGKVVTDIVIPDGMTKIRENAFNGFINLKSVTIPNSVVTIESAAFWNCRNLDGINLPDNLVTIGSSAFRNCINLNKINLPNSLEKIGNWAFSDCVNLKEVIIPNKVSYIGNWAFKNCENIENIIIPNKITSIEEHTFYECKKLKKITLPENLEKIGESAFSTCYKLKSIVIPNSVSCIENYAFATCKLLKSVELPDNITCISDHTFDGCDSLKNIIIPDNVTSIGKNAFYFCKALSSIYIPYSVTSIGDYAFFGCDSLWLINIGENVSIGENALVKSRSKNGAKIECNKYPKEKLLKKKPKVKKKR